MINRARRLVLVVTFAIASLLMSGIVAAPSASASAQTCVTGGGGAMCTSVVGAGTHVEEVYSIYDSIIPSNVLGWVCNTRAWYFEIPPGGGVNDLGTEQRDGCHTAGRTWLAKSFNRDFSAGSTICTKFYVNDWSEFIGQRCVGITS